MSRTDFDEAFGAASPKPDGFRSKSAIAPCGADARGNQAARQYRGSLTDKPSE
jgi:hypothetical protein